MWKKGQSGHPPGYVQPKHSFAARFRDAVEAFEKKHKTTIFEMALKRARKSDALMAKVLDKTVASKNELTFGQDDLMRILEQVVNILLKYVPKEKLQYALADVKRIEEMEAGVDSGGAPAMDAMIHAALVPPTDSMPQVMEH
jgi:hypothetical protein